MEVIQKDGKVDPRVASRYTVVLAAAKRARQLTEGAEPLTYAPTERAVSIAVKEMSEGKLHVRVQEDLMDNGYERLVKDQFKFRAITALSKDDLREDLKDDYSFTRTYKLEDDDDTAGEELFKNDSFADVEEVELPASTSDEDEPAEDELEPYENEGNDTDIDDVDESFDE